MSRESKSLTVKHMHLWFIKECKKKIEQLKKGIIAIEQEKSDIRLKAYETKKYHDENVRFKKLNRQIVEHEREIKNLEEQSKLTYKEYNEIIRAFNRNAIEHILNGGTLAMGERLSSLYIKKVERDHTKPRVNWPATMRQQKETGIMRYIYYTDNHWFHWHWSKSYCTIPNKTVYYFKTTRGETGNRKKLHRLLKSSKLAQHKFQ